MDGDGRMDGGSHQNLNITMENLRNLADNGSQTEKRVNGCCVSNLNHLDTIQKTAAALRVATETDTSTNRDCYIRCP